MHRFLWALPLLFLPSLAQAACAPEFVTNLSVVDGRFSVVLNWTAPHSDCTSGGSVSGYAVRYSTSPITEQNFWSATPITDVPFSGSSPGTQECGDILSLSQGTTYYVALKSKDSSGNWSALSNVVSFTTHTSGTSPVCG